MAKLNRVRGTGAGDGSSARHRRAVSLVAVAALGLSACNAPSSLAPGAEPTSTTARRAVEGQASAPSVAAPESTSDVVAREIKRSQSLLAGGLALQRAVQAAAAAGRLKAGAGAGSPAAVESLLKALVAGHHAHLIALGAPDGAPSSGASESPKPPAPPLPAGLIAQLTAESSGARQALNDAVAARSPLLAGLLARIAAARATHADLIAGWLGRRPPPPFWQPAPPLAPSAGADAPALDPGSRQGLSELLSGEHAAVFAFGLVTARLPRASRDQGHAQWAVHVNNRNELEQYLISRQTTPPAAAPAYDVGPLPGSAAAATALAVKVEDGLAAVSLTALTRVAVAERRFVAAQLIESARRAALWRGTPVALPG